MTTSFIYKIIIAVLFILLFLACGGEKKTDHPVRFCQDSSRNVVTVDRLNGYRLRSDIDLPIVLNLHLFQNAKDFENYFVQRADTLYDSLNFEVFSVAAIILDDTGAWRSYYETRVTLGCAGLCFLYQQLYALHSLFLEELGVRRKTRFISGSNSSEKIAFS